MCVKPRLVFTHFSLFMKHPKHYILRKLFFFVISNICVCYHTQTSATFMLISICCSRTLHQKQASCLVALSGSDRLSSMVNTRLVYQKVVLRGVTVGWKEGNILFNDTLNTFYLRLYGVRHMVKDHSDSDNGNLMPPHMLLLPINSKSCNTG